MSQFFDNFETIFINLIPFNLRSNLILKNQVKVTILDDQDGLKNTQAINKLFSDSEQIDELNAKPIENVRDFDHKTTFI